MVLLTALSTVLIDRLGPGCHSSWVKVFLRKGQVYLIEPAVLIIHVLKGLGRHRHQDAYIHRKFGLNRKTYPCLLHPHLSAIPMFLETRNHHPNPRLEGTLMEPCSMIDRVPAIQANGKYHISYLMFFCSAAHAPLDVWRRCAYAIESAHDPRPCSAVPRH